MDKLTVRLSASDAANIVTIANALRTDRQPFVTRSAALKVALAVVAKDPQRFIEGAMKGAPRGGTTTAGVGR